MSDTKPPITIRPKDMTACIGPEGVTLPVDPTQEVWVGVTDEGRRMGMFGADVGGTHFPYYVGNLTQDIRGEILWDQLERGQILHLSQVQLDRIEAGLRERYVRRTGATFKHFKYNATSRVRAGQGDIPLARFLFLVPVPTDRTEGWRRRIPAPLFDASKSIGLEDDLPPASDLESMHHVVDVPEGEEGAGVALGPREA